MSVADLELRDGWIFGEVDGVEFEHRLMPRPGNAPLVDRADVKLGCQHCIEGGMFSTVDTAWNTMQSNGVGVHGILGAQSAMPAAAPMSCR